MMEILGYIAMLVVGLLLGSIGSGGSMLSVPVLLYLFSLDMQMASAYSLFLVGTTSLTGAILKHKDQLVSLSAGLIFGVPSVISTFITRRWLLDRIPERIGCVQSLVLQKEDLLICLFSVMMIGSGLAILGRGALQQRSNNCRRPVHLIICGFLVGGIAGLAGAGGGFLILPALLFFAGLSFPVAVGTTLMIIASNCLLGFCGAALIQPIDWSFLFSITALAVGGLLVGLTSDRRFIAVIATEKTFGWLTICLGLVILINQFVL